MAKKRVNKKKRVDPKQPNVQTRRYLETRAKRIREALGRREKAVLTIGKALVEAKARMPHGQWGKWLASEFDWTPRTAQNYMKAYQHVEQNPDDAGLSLKEVYQKASESREQKRGSKKRKSPKSGRKSKGSAATKGTAVPSRKTVVDGLRSAFQLADRYVHRAETRLDGQQMDKVKALLEDLGELVVLLEKS